MTIKNKSVTISGEDSGDPEIISQYIDKDIFKLGMKNSSWKDKFITRWNIVSNFTQNELKNEATEIIKMEGIK